MKAITAATIKRPRHPQPASPANISLLLATPPDPGGRGWAAATCGELAAGPCGEKGWPGLGELGVGGWGGVCTGGL